MTRPPKGALGGCPAPAVCCWVSMPACWLRVLLAGLGSWGAKRRLYGVGKRGRRSTS